MDSSISIILHAYVHYSLSIWKYCRVSERNISEYLDKRETIAWWMNHTLTLTKLCSEYLKMKFAVVLYGDKRKYLPSSRSFDSTIICPTTGCPSSCWSSYAVGGEFLLKESLGHLEKNEIDIEAIWSMWIQLSLPDTCLLRVSTNTPNSSSKRWQKQIFSKFLYISKLLFIYTSTNVFL